MIPAQQSEPVRAGPWGIYTGDSFTNQAQPGIDCHSTHLWVDNWNVAEPDSTDDTSVATSAPNPATSFVFDRTWLSTRKAAAQSDGRPFIIEEWGEHVASQFGRSRSMYGYKPPANQALQACR